MEFDKSRVYTALNADELKAGDKVIVADTMAELKMYVEQNAGTLEIERIEDDNCTSRFTTPDINSWRVHFPLAYLVERKENCTNCEYEGSAGCSVVEICGESKSTHRCHMYKAKDTKRNLCDLCKNSFAECPATPDDVKFGDGFGNDNVYECDKYEQKSEPHYRPFKNIDELVKVWVEKTKPYRVDTRIPPLIMPLIWVREKGCEKSADLITCYGSKGITVRGKGMYFDTLFAMFEFLDGSPCGVEAKE